jgi:hypothetical protein
MNLRRYPDIDTIKNHPAHRSLILKKKPSRSFNYKDLIKNTNEPLLSIGSSLKKSKYFDKVANQGYQKKSYSPEYPINSLYKYKKIDSYIQDTDLYKKIFHRRNHQKVRKIKTKQFIDITSKNKKAFYSIELSEKLARIRKEKSVMMKKDNPEDFYDKSCNINIYDYSPESKNCVLSPELKNTDIKKYFIDKWGLKGQTRFQDQMSRLAESKKQFQECIIQTNDEFIECQERFNLKLKKSYENSIRAEEVRLI